MENNSNLLTWLNTKLVLGLCIIASAGIGAYAFTQAQAINNALSVTGSATMNVTSDHVKWVGAITHIVKISTLKQGYADMARDLTTTETFMKSNGITDADMVVSPVFMEQNYDQNNNGSERTYTLRQTIDINSSDVAKITELTKKTGALIDQGVVFSTQSLEYTYSKLSEARVSMLGDAIIDAKNRASQLALSSGKKIGALKSASSGVVQVLSANSLDVSDYGTYDTSKIEKTIMLTVKASFTLK